jgi:hypothetical protein
MYFFTKPTIFLNSPDESYIRYFGCNYRKSCDLIIPCLYNVFITGWKYNKVNNVCFDHSLNFMCKKMTFFIHFLCVFKYLINISGHL